MRIRPAIPKEELFRLSEERRAIIREERRRKESAVIVIPIGPIVVCYFA